MTDASSLAQQTQMVPSQRPPNAQFQDPGNAVVNGDENVSKSSRVQDPNLIMIIYSPPHPSHKLPQINALAENEDIAPRRWP